MSDHSNSKYILKTPDSGSLPNSTYLNVVDQMQINQSFTTTEVAPSLNLKKLADFNETGLLVNTASGLEKVYILGEQGIKINDGDGILGNIDVQFIPDSTSQLINVSTSDTDLTNIKKITLVAAENIEISGYDDGFNNRTNITIKNTAVSSGQTTTIVTNVSPENNISTFESVVDPITDTVTITGGYNFSSSPVEGSVIKAVKNEGIEGATWGDPISNLQSLTIDNPNSVYKLVSNPTTITNEADGTLTLQIDAPGTPGTKFLGFDTGTSQATWIDGSSTNLSELFIQTDGFDDGMSDIFILSCDQTQPITSTGNYTLSCLPQTDKRVLTFTDNNPNPGYSIGAEYVVENANVSIAANSVGVMSIADTGTNGNPDNYVVLNTTGAAVGDGFQYNHLTGSVERVALSSSSKVSSVGLNIIAGSQPVISVSGTPNPITSTGTLTVQHKTVPFPTFAGVNQYGQFPGYFGNNKMEWGKLASGPLLLIAQGQSQFPSTPVPVAPNYTTSVQVYSQVINGLDPTRIIAIATSGGSPIEGAINTMSIGTMTTKVTYAANTLTLVVESNFSRYGTSEANTGVYWQLYYYPNY